MKCPYCNQEMHTGYIPNSSQPVQWLPEGEKASIWRGGVSPNAVRLSARRPMFGDHQAISHLCVACRVIITPVPESKKK